MPQLHNPAKKKNLTPTFSSLDRKNSSVISHLEGERILCLSRGKDYQKVPIHMLQNKEEKN